MTAYWAIGLCLGLAAAFVVNIGYALQKFSWNETHHDARTLETKQADWLPRGKGRRYTRATRKAHRAVLAGIAGTVGGHSILFAKGFMEVFKSVFVFGRYDELMVRARAPEQSAAAAGAAARRSPCLRPRSTT